MNSLAVLDVCFKDRLDVFLMYCIGAAMVCRAAKGWAQSLSTKKQNEQGSMLMTLMARHDWHVS